MGEVYQDKKWQVIAVSNLGLIYWTRGKLDTAEHMYKKALELDEALYLNQSLNCWEEIARDFSGMSYIYKIRGELDKAAQMRRKAREIHKKKRNFKA